MPTKSKARETRALREFQIELVTAATTAATAAATAAAVITTRSAATATATAAATGTFFAGTRYINRQITAVNRCAIESFNCFLRFFRRAHRDETEPAWAAADAVHHQVRFHDGAVCCEHV